MNKKVRKLLIVLLDDTAGINSEAYYKLLSLVINHLDVESADIFAAVRSTEGRFYLPENHGLTA